MKKILQTILGAAGLLAVTCLPAAAQGLSVNGAFTSNYVWRGFTQSNNHAAVQGGADYDFGNGLAVGTWASMVDFNDDTNAEWDIYGGYTGMFNDMFGYTVGAIAYLYPDAPDGADYSFFEGYAGLNANLGPAALSGKIYYSPNVFGTSDDYSLYYTAGITIPFAEFLAASGNIGYYDFETGTNITDWNIGLSATYMMFTASVMYAGNDLPGTDEYLVGTIGVKISVP
jgi:uncharacterized protein (TIGR02001 family)